MKIEPLAPHPIVKIKPVKNDNHKRRQEPRPQKQKPHVEEQEEESSIPHIDEII
jgi:hypothetical protein